MKEKMDQVLNKFLRVRAYIRYSTVNQDDGFSIEYQMSEIEQYLKKNNMTLEKAHIDQAQSASKVAGRDEFFAIINDVKNGLVDIIIVYKMNRLFRNALESHKYRKLFREHGVKIISVTQHIDEDTSEGRFMTNTLANVDQYNSETTSDHVKSSMKEMARQGYYTGGRVLFGYDLKSIDHGGRIRKKYIPNPEQAKIVNLIFNMFAKEKSVVQIMNYLREENIKNRYGKYFNEQNLRQMLKNDCYIGIMRYKVQNEDEVVTQNAHEPIIDDNLWKAVQHEMSKHRRLEPRLKKYYYSLTGKVFCACGSHFFGTSSSAVRGEKRYVYHSYVCRQKRALRNCDVPQITKEKLENMVLSAIKTNILNAEKIESLSREIMDSYANAPYGANDKIKEKNARKKDIQKELNILIDMRINGEINGEIIKQRSAPLEMELLEIEKHLYALNQQLKHTLTIDDVKNFLHDMLHKAENCNDKVMKEIFDCFVKDIIVYHDEIKINLRAFSAPEFAYNEKIATPIFRLSAHIRR